MKISEASQVLRFLRRVTCTLSSRVISLVWGLSGLHTTLQTSCLHMDAPTTRLSIQNYLHIPETASTSDYQPSSQACRLCTRSGKLSLFHEELSMEDHWDKQEALVCLVSTEATQKDYPSRSRSSLCRTLACALPLMSCLSFDSSNFPQKQKHAEIERRPVKSYQGFLYLCSLILEAGDLDAITACLRHGSGVDA
jgi:hypothetical protein